MQGSGPRKKPIRGGGRFYFYFFLVLGPAQALVFSGQSSPSANRILHSSVSAFNHGEAVEIKASIAGEVAGMEFLVRYTGLKQFQVRRMEKGNNNVFTFAFDTTELPGLEFEYYLSAQAGEERILFPAQAPEQTIKVAGTSAKPIPRLPEDLIAPIKTRKKFQFPMMASAAGEQKFVEVEKGFQKVEERVSANGNVRLFQNYQSGDFAMNFDSNLPYATTPPPGQNEFDLSNMMVSLSKRNHAVRAGDLNIYESEFTINAFGRRGMEYVFDNRRVYFHVFDVSSQQMKGFRGFGIPRSDISLVGGAAGFSLFRNASKTKAVFLTGKDNPLQGQNVGASFTMPGREGSVMALVEELRLFQNRLELKAEIAHSKNNSPGDSGNEISGNAWNVRARFGWKFLNLGAGYKHIGKDFNPIGYQFFTKDRQGLETSLGLVYGRFNLMGTYTSEQDNVEDNPLQRTAENSNQGVALSWAPWNAISLQVGYRTGKQKIQMKDTQTSFQDILTRQYTGSVNFMLGMAANLNVSASSIDMTNQINPAWDRKDLTLNLGAGIRAGEYFSFCPNLSLTQTTNKFTQQKTQSFNSFVMTEIAFYPRVASFSLTGGMSRFEVFPGNISDSLNIAGNLNVLLRELIKVMQVGIVLTGNYQRLKFQGRADSHFDMRLKFNFAF
jgi:hypothetical protein